MSSDRFFSCLQEERNCLIRLFSKTTFLVFHSERGRLSAPQTKSSVVVHSWLVQWKQNGFASMYMCYSCGGISSFKVRVETQTCAHTLKTESVFWCLAAAHRFLFLVYNFLLRLGEACVSVKLWENLGSVEGDGLAELEALTQRDQLPSHILPLLYGSGGNQFALIVFSISLSALA